MQEKFESWAMVELMGHKRVAGRVTEQKFGNESMLRIDVPATDTVPAYTKIVAVNAVYAINPMTEEDARSFAALLKSMPLEEWDMQNIFHQRIEKLVKMGQLSRALEATIDRYDDDDDDRALGFEF